MREGRSVRGPRRSPADRVRDRVRESAGERPALEMPDGYQRMGRVLLLRLPPRYRPYAEVIARAWQQELGVSTVLNQVGPVAGEFREPRVEVWAGEETETEVLEHGVRWRFDAARLMFAAGNRAERRRARTLVTPGESVVDLFAGIGYFAIPAALTGERTRVLAVEKNPLAFRYLVENIVRNDVAERVDCLLGENRTVELPRQVADRVFLGYLPDAMPWVPLAAELLRPGGGWVHAHTVVDVRQGTVEAVRQLRVAAAEAGAAAVDPPNARVVKPYGPGRVHVVVDAHLRRPN
jgi:tRNA wybutosine-synthesizing protein 2